jgi:hypothetical protein
MIILRCQVAGTGLGLSQVGRSTSPTEKCRVFSMPRPIPSVALYSSFSHSPLFLASHHRHLWKCRHPGREIPSLPEGRQRQRAVTSRLQSFSQFHWL